MCILQLLHHLEAVHWPAYRSSTNHSGNLATGTGERLGSILFHIHVRKRFTSSGCADLFPPFGTLYSSHRWSTASLKHKKRWIPVVWLNFPSFPFAFITQVFVSFRLLVKRPVSPYPPKTHIWCDSDSTALWAKRGGGLLSTATSLQISASASLGFHEFPLWICAEAFESWKEFD